MITHSPMDLRGLCNAAIEAAKAFVETKLPQNSTGHAILYSNARNATSAFRAAATPEAILSLLDRIKELENDLQLLCGTKEPT